MDPNRWETAFSALLERTINNRWVSMHNFNGDAIHGN